MYGHRKQKHRYRQAMAEGVEAVRQEETDEKHAVATEAKGDAPVDEQNCEVACGDDSSEDGRDKDTDDEMAALCEDEDIMFG